MHLSIPEYLRSVTHWGGPYYPGPTANESLTHKHAINPDYQYNVFCHVIGIVGSFHARLMTRSLTELGDISEKCEAEALAWMERHQFINNIIKMRGAL